MSDENGLQNKLLKDILEEQRTQRTDISKKVGELHGKIDAVRAEQNEQAVQLVRIEGAIKGNRNDIGTLKKTSGEQASKMEELEDSVGSARTKVSIGILAFLGGIATLLGALRLLPLLMGLLK